MLAKKQNGIFLMTIGFILGVKGISNYYEIFMEEQRVALIGKMFSESHNVIFLHTPQERIFSLFCAISGMILFISGLIIVARSKRIIIDKQCVALFICYFCVLPVSIATSFLLTTILNFCANYYYDAWDIDGPGIGMGLAIFSIGNVIVFAYVYHRLITEYFDKRKKRFMVVEQKIV